MREILTIIALALLAWAYFTRPLPRGVLALADAARLAAPAERLLLRRIRLNLFLRDLMWVVFVNLALWAPR